MRLDESAVFHALPAALAQRFTVTFVFFLGWCGVFLALYSRPTSERLMRKVSEDARGKGPRMERQELATRMTGLLHAALIAAGSASLLFFRGDSPLYVRRLWDWKSWPDFEAFDERAVFYACAASGYFVADLIITVVLLEENGPEFLVHAVAGLGGSAWCVVHGRGLVYLMVLMLFEVSTPFLHVRWLLLEYGYKDSLVFILNGLALVFAFTACRIVIGFPVIAKLIFELHTSLVGQESIVTRVFFTLAGLAMCALNAKWGVALWMGFLRALGLVKRREKPHASRTVQAMTGKEE